MTTRETLQAYFSSLELKEDWQSFLADDMTFTSFTSPIKRISGRAAYIESTKRSSMSSRCPRPITCGCIVRVNTPPGHRS